MFKESTPVTFVFGSSVSEISRHSSVAIALTRINNSYYYVYLFDLIVKLRARGVQLTILNFDLNRLITSDVIPLLRNRRNREARILQSIQYRKVFLRYVENLCKIIDIEPMDSSNNSCSQIKRETLQEILDANQITEYAKRSIESICSTDILKTARQDQSLSRFQVNAILELIASYKFVYQYFAENSLSHSYGAVVVLNGRVPDQAAVIEASEFLGLEWFSLEHGGTPGQTYHLQNFQTQEHSAFQNFFWRRIPQIGGGQRDVMIAGAKKWLTDRRLSPPTFGNPIVQRDKKYFGKSGRKFAFFTSSLSEFDRYNDSPNNLSQVDSFRKLLESLSLGSDDEVVVRIHPNQINYSICDLSNILSVFRGFTTTVIFPWEPDSSYEIASQADFRFFWDSTLGLETMVNTKRGIFILTSSFYDSLKGVSVVDFSRAAAEPNSIHLTESQVEIALLYIYYRFIGHGESVERSSSSLATHLKIELNTKKVFDHVESRFFQKYWFATDILLRVFYGHATLANYLQLIRSFLGAKKAHFLLTAYFKRFMV